MLGGLNLKSIRRGDAFFCNPAVVIRAGGRRSIGRPERKMGDHGRQAPPKPELTTIASAGYGTAWIGSSSYTTKRKRGLKATVWAVVLSSTAVKWPGKRIAGEGPRRFGSAAFGLAQRDLYLCPDFNLLLAYNLGFRVGSPDNKTASTWGWRRSRVNIRPS